MRTVGVDHAAGLWLADAARPGALSRHRVFGVVPRWPLARLGATMHSASLTIDVED